MVFSSIVAHSFSDVYIWCISSISNIFAQETAITDGNITGGGINVPLNETNI